MWGIPIFAVILLLLFFVQDLTRVAQFEKLVGGDLQTELSFDEEQALWQKISNRRGWDLPSFYFGFQHPGWSDTCYSLFPLSYHEFVRDIGRKTLDVDQTIAIGHMLLKLKADLRGRSDYGRLNELFKQNNAERVMSFIRATDMLNPIPFYTAAQKKLRSSHESKSIVSALPKLRWSGFENRFHFFIRSFLTSSFRSETDGRPIFRKIWPAFSITLFINLLALVIVLFIGVPLGQYLYKNENWRTRILEKLIYVIYAMPLFWLATIIAINGNNAGFLSGVPVLKSGEMPSIMTFLRFENIGFLILPVLTIVISVLVVVALHMKRSMQEVAENKYVFAARMRGENSVDIDKKHVRSNAVFSIITLIGSTLPGLVSGSVVIEIIFNLPGMGRLLWQALYDFDWVLVFGILFVGVVFSVIGQLITDLFYRKINPQVVL